MRQRRMVSSAIFTVLVSVCLGHGMAQEPPGSLAEAFMVPEQYRDDFGEFRSPLQFNDGSPVTTGNSGHDAAERSSKHGTRYSARGRR